MTFILGRIMTRRIAAILIWPLIAGALPASAQTSSWRVLGSTNAPPFKMSFSFGAQAVGYQFECRANAVVITETGVTQLMDPQTGQKISDAPGAEITPLASTMGLFTDKVQPKLAPASAKLNPVRGWDLTITLPADDPAFRSLKTATTMSLMTTGWTGLVELSPQDRKLISTFVDGCRPS